MYSSAWLSYWAEKNTEAQANSSSAFDYTVSFVKDSNCSSSDFVSYVLLSIFKTYF